LFTEDTIQCTNNAQTRQYMQTIYVAYMQMTTSQKSKEPRLRNLFLKSKNFKNSNNYY